MDVLESGWKCLKRLTCSGWGGFNRGYVLGEISMQRGGVDVLESGCTYMHGCLEVREIDVG